jgi:LysM repeat protein
MRKAWSRLLALVAIGGCAAAIYLVLQSNHLLHKNHHDSASVTTTTTTTPGSTTKHHHSLYTVKNGDILSTIAEKHHVTVAQIEKLNPHLDASALHAGQRIHLR